MRALTYNMPEIIFSYSSHQGTWFKLRASSIWAGFFAVAAIPRIVFVCGRRERGVEYRITNGDRDSRSESRSWIILVLRLSRRLSRLFCERNTPHHWVNLSRVEQNGPLNCHSENTLFMVVLDCKTILSTWLKLYDFGSASSKTSEQNLSVNILVWIWTHFGTRKISWRPRPFLSWIKAGYPWAHSVSSSADNAAAGQ